MDWTIIAGLILKEGLPFAEKVWKKWNSGTQATQADFDELKALGANTPRSQMLAAMVRNGVNVDSPEAVALLALIQ